MTIELRPFDESHDSLLQLLQQQEDVWEFIGARPLSAYESGNHVFAIMDGDVALGLVGLFKSRAAGGDHFELVCATRSEAQHRGITKEACELVLDWALGTAGMERVIACIDESNQPARAIAEKLGMKQLRPLPDNRILYATDSKRVES